MLILFSKEIFLLVMNMDSYFIFIICHMSNSYGNFYNLYDMCEINYHHFTFWFLNFAPWNNFLSPSYMYISPLNILILPYIFMQCYLFCTIFLISLSLSFCSFQTFPPVQTLSPSRPASLFLLLFLLFTCRSSLTFCQQHLLTSPYFK